MSRSGVLASLRLRPEGGCATPVKFRALLAVHSRLVDACVITQHECRRHPEDAAVWRKAQAAQFMLSWCLCHEVAHVSDDSILSPFSKQTADVG